MTMHVPRSIEAERGERKKEGNNVTEKELYEHVGRAEEIVVRPVNE